MACVVSGCGNSYCSRPENVSFHKMPMDVNARKEWCRSLGVNIPLKKKVLVCSSHFEKRDFLNCAGKIYLNSKAVPSLKLAKSDNSRYIPLQKCKSVGAPQQKAAVSFVQMLPSTSISKKQPAVEENRNENSKLIELHHLESSKEDLVRNDTSKEFQRNEMHHMKDSRTIAVNDDVIQESFPPALIIDSMVSLEDIHAYFTSILMQGWCFFAADGELIFIHTNISTRKEDMRFSVTNDFSLKVSFSQRPEFSVDANISSIDDIKIVMENLETTILCKGTGIEHSEFASKCTGQISSNDFHSQRQKSRCSWCRSLLQRLRRKKCTDDSTLKLRNCKQVVQRLRKQYRKLVLKQESLEKKFTNAKAEDARRLDELLESKISELPKPQQMSVLTCFNAAKQKNTNIQRYGLSWIRECILFQLRSSDAYNFIRERNILPFPRQDTLDKYIQKISASACLDDLVDGNSAADVSNSWNDSPDDHNYNIARSPEVKANIAGYMLQEMQQSIKCELCISNLKANAIEQACYELINTRDMYSGLWIPSTKLFHLLDIIEKRVLNVIRNSDVQWDTIHTILDQVLTEALPKVGCNDHQLSFTVQVIDTYLKIRGHFSSEYLTKKNNETIKTDLKRKCQKL